MTLQDGRVVVPGQLFDTDVTLRDRQPIAVEPDGTVVPRYTELGRIEPLYQIVYAHEDMAPWGTPWHETFLGTVLNGDSLEYEVLSYGVHQYGGPPPEGSSWVDNTLVAQDGSKLAVREQLYRVNSIVPGEEDAFSLLRVGRPGDILLPGERLMTYDGVTITDTRVVNQDDEELARLAFHTLIEHGALTLADGMILTSGTTLTPEDLANLASHHTTGTLTEDGRTPVWTHGAQGEGSLPALLVTQTVVESGELAYYEEDPSPTTLSLSGWAHYISYQFSFRQGQPTFDGSFLTFTDAGQIVDGDGTLLGTGRPLETVTGLPGWVGSWTDYIYVTHYNGAPWNAHSGHNELFQSPFMLRYVRSVPEFSYSLYHPSIRASGDTAGSYDTSSGRRWSRRRFTQKRPRRRRLRL